MLPRSSRVIRATKASLLRARKENPLSAAVAAGEGAFALIADVLVNPERRSDSCELIELTDSELDEVSGGNPFSINLSGLSASVGSTITLALSFHRSFD